MSPQAADRSGSRFQRRHGVLGAVLAGTLLASLWALDGNDAGDGATTGPTRSPAAAGNDSASARRAVPSVSVPAPAAALEGLTPMRLPQRAASQGARRNLFPAGPAQAVASQAPVAAPPPPVSLPFSFGGRLVTQGGTSVLLNEGGITHMVAVGDTLGEFRFEQEGPGELAFTHVPSGEHVVLALQP